MNYKLLFDVLLLWFSSKLLLVLIYPFLPVPHFCVFFCDRQWCGTRNKVIWVQKTSWQVKHRVDHQQICLFSIWHFSFNLHSIRIGCFILKHLVCNVFLWCPMGLRVTQVCRTQHVLAAHAYCLQLLRKYICWKCWDVFMDEITSYVLLKLLPTRICRI